MRGGRCIAMWLDYTRSIKSTLNNGIHNIHFPLHMSFIRQSCGATKGQCWSINIWSVYWTTCTANHSNGPTSWACFTQNVMSGFMIWYPEGAIRQRAIINPWQYRSQYPKGIDETEWICLHMHCNWVWICDWIPSQQELWNRVYLPNLTNSDRYQKLGTI